MARWLPMVLAVCATATATEPRTRVLVEFPGDGIVVGQSTCGVFVAGRAVARARDFRRFDVAVVIDISESTRGPSGADIDGDGQVGVPEEKRMGQGYTQVVSSDPGDSILASEVAAARRLLSQVDQRITRVAVITFSGFPPDTVPIGSVHGRNSVTRVPLTSDYARVELALDRILAEGPAGGTHMAAGIERATGELLGSGGFDSPPDPDARKIVLFFTDGQPTLPHLNDPAANVRAVLGAAARARLATVRIYSFALGPHALEGPIASVDMAALTGGTFIPVRNAGDVVELVGAVEFTELSDVSLRNLTTGKDAEPFHATADGGWGGLVRIAPGRNRVEVVVRSDTGGEARHILELRFDEEAGSQEIPREFSFQYNRLLAECLSDLRRRRQGIEARQVQRLRKDLALEIERERAAATRRAEQQRRELQIELDELGLD